MCKLVDGSTKSILILTRYGNDGPRLPSSSSTLFNMFREHHLDFLFCVCSFLGLSNYNSIEGKIDPHTAALTGLVSPHEHFGSHRDASGRKIDVQLGKKLPEKHVNFFVIFGAT